MYTRWVSAHVLNPTPVRTIGSEQEVVGDHSDEDGDAEDEDLELVLLNELFSPFTHGHNDEGFGKIANGA